MKEPSKEALADMLLAIVGIELTHHLSTAKDEAAALRKALLYLIFLSQERVSPAGHEFVQFLLTDFPAIKEYEGQFIYPFMFGEVIKNALLDNGDKQVVLNKSFFEKFDRLMEEDKLHNGKLPHSFFQRIETFFDTYSDN